MTEPEDDIEAEIFAPITFEPSAPPPREFQPWHRPRKQYVRREQWVVQIRKLFDGADPQRPVRYLGLPGIDLLDLRYIHAQVCARMQRELLFLGFNTEAGGGGPAGIELNTSLDEVRRLPQVDSQSMVVKDDFRTLARKTSMGWKSAFELGPFDVVNLDLCDGFGSDDPERDDTLYQALSALVALQARSKTPWLLLLTTRVGRDHVHDTTLQKWLERYGSNVESCEPFVDACEKFFGEHPGGVDPDECSELTFMRLSLVSMAKWLLGLAQKTAPTKVEISSTQAYRVDSQRPCEDLASIAIRFEPVIAPPPDALVAAAAMNADECKEAAGLVRRLAKMKNVDELLASEPKALERSVVEMEELLGQARYPVDDYRPWAMNG